MLTKKEVFHEFDHYICCVCNCVVYLEGVSELEPLQEFPESPEIVW